MRNNSNDNKSNQSSGGEDHHSQESSISTPESRFNQTLRNVQGLLKGRSMPGKVLLTRRSELVDQSNTQEPALNYARSFSYNDAETSVSISKALEEAFESPSEPNANESVTKLKISTSNVENTSKGPQKSVIGARATDSARVMKFTKVLSGTTVILEKLRELAWSGIPPYMRPDVWRLLLGYAPSNSDRREGVLRRKRLEYLDCVSQYYDIPDTERSDDEINMLRQISVDCPRTVPDVSFFQQEQVQKSLERILYTWSSVWELTNWCSSMEKLRKAVNEIAYTQHHAKLSHLQLSLIPILFFASSLYSAALSLRRALYRSGLITEHRLPVPVISVGNLTWGGNGKTPMVEFIANYLADSGISPLILTRGYAGGDEAKMLYRHFLGRPVKIGVGAKRAAVAAHFFERYGYVDPCSSKHSEGLCHGEKVGSCLSSEKIGTVILDDGMQHWSLQRNLEIVMINALTLWGNCHLIPRGPLREPLNALRRADVVVLHHADLVSKQNLEETDLMLREVNKSVPVFFTKMDPCYFFNLGNATSRKPVEDLSNTIVLCVSAIGSANAFAKGIEKIGAFYVDRLEFSDHHKFLAKDIEMIKRRLRELEDRFSSKPVVIVTEKDYDRDPNIFKHLDPYEVLSLCSKLKIIPNRGCTEDSFKKMLEVCR